MQTTPLSRDELLRKLKRLKRFLPRGFRAKELSDDELHAAWCAALRQHLAHRIIDDDPSPHWPVWLWRLVRSHNHFVEELALRYFAGHPLRIYAMWCVSAALLMVALIRVLGG